MIVRDHRVLQRYAYTLALAGVFFLMLPAVLPARFSEVNGARIWIRLAGFSIQPGEFAKILLTIFGAAYLVQKRDVLALAGKRILGIDFPRGRDFGPLLLVWLLCIGVLVRGHDLGTSLLFFGLFVVLLYVATERVSWVIVGVLLFAGGAYVAYQLFGTVQTRVGVWLHPFSPTSTTPPAYQLRQSLFGLGTGGIFGTGLGNGHPELVPLPATDFIISSFGEEIGLFGLAGLLVLYGVLVARGLRRRARGARLVRQAARLRAGVPRRAAAVRRRRRRDPAAARDRADHAVPVLRRLVAARQLGRCSRCCCGSPTPRAGRPPPRRPRRAEPRAGGRGMNRPIRKVTIALAVLFLALFVNLNVVQVFKGDSYRDDPQNRRVLLNEYSSPRGQIVVQGDERRRVGGRPRTS